MNVALSYLALLVGGWSVLAVIWIIGRRLLWAVNERTLLLNVLFFALLACGGTWLVVLIVLIASSGG